ncbi:MAG TPA: phosphoglycerate mutase family protein [Thermoanaerobaculia bacterium]|nr:phosphoglycerate mutase family protein [Thermoanaerobaculia bacterium]
MKPDFTFAFAIAVLILASPHLQAHSEGQIADTTVIVVRHAEKVSDDRDPVLSEKGKDRARVLAQMLGETAIDAIYTTQYLRTRQTAEPLAARLNLDAIALEATDTHISELADRIRTAHRGHVVLIVGHSNTVPAILAALGASDSRPIGDEEYDHLYILTIRGDDTAQLLTLRYGAAGASPAHAARVKR